MISPLEQFEICLWPIIPGFFYITNSAAYLVVCFAILLFFFENFFTDGLSPVFFSIWAYSILFVYNLLWKICKDMLKTPGLMYFPYVFVLFLFILCCNCVGLIPYSFTATSHLIITFTLAFAAFFAINFLGVKKHSYRIIGLFLPPGSPLLLAPLLVIIEIISYFFRVISLSVRLFANMMSGHTLVKILSDFGWIMFINSSTFLVTLHIMPFVLITILTFLESGIAILQAYVFTILVCIYLGDCLNLH